MQAQNFMRVEEVAQELGISKSHAYKVIHKLNAELREKGYLTISGRVNRNFFMEKFCYGKTGKGVQDEARGAGLGARTAQQDQRRPGYDLQELRGPLHGGYENSAQRKHLGH